MPRYTAEDKARVIATLEANGGNVKRTSRDTGIPEQTVRDWKHKMDREGGPPAEVAEVLPAVTGEIVENVRRVRDKALLALERAIDKGEVKGRDLTVAVGVLTDKERLMTGQATSRTEHQGEAGSLPVEQVRELFKGLAAGIVEAAQERAATISTVVDGEATEVTDEEQADFLALPAAASDQEVTG